MALMRRGVSLGAEDDRRPVSEDTDGDWGRRRQQRDTRRGANVEGELGSDALIEVSHGGGRLREGRPDCSDLRQAHGSENVCGARAMFLFCLMHGKKARAFITSLKSSKSALQAQAALSSHHQRDSHLASTPW